MSPLELDLNHLILNSNEPLIFKKYLKSDLLHWTLDNWKSVLENHKLEFRCGKNKRSKRPQWERNTELKIGTFDDFLDQQKNTEEWLYFDYKHLNTWLDDIQEIKNNISWAPLGFPEVKPEDCTIWIGTKGAHTCCHVDTYGFNLIFQIYGSKLWTVFPPEENLRPTRIPYEESSIFSKLNFFSPTIEDFKGIGNCRQIELKAGDVLFLPHKWWHYVENLETSISINVWLPHPEDDSERLKESMVQLLVKQLSKDLDNNVKNIILNPNMEMEIQSSSLKESFNIVNTCRTICENKNPHKRIKPNLKASKKVKEDYVDIEDIISRHSFISKIPILSQEEFLRFCQEQNDRFDGESIEAEPPNTDKDINSVVDVLTALTDPEIIQLVSNKLLKS